MLLFKLDQLWLKFFRTFRKFPAKILIDAQIISHNYRIRLNGQWCVFQNAQQTNK